MLASSVTKLFKVPVMYSKWSWNWTSPLHYSIRRWWSSKHTSESERVPVPPIPRDKLHFHFTASSGPGGQNVNHVNTKAELRFKPIEAHWIPDEMRERFIAMNQHRMNKEGFLIITSQRERKQEQNVEDCVAKLKQYLNEASWIPKERIATEVPEHENEKRIHVRTIRSSVAQFPFMGTSSSY